MREVQRICDQVRRAASGGAWFGPSLSEVLKDIPAARAAARPIAAGHSIWENVLHITYWTATTRGRLKGIDGTPTVGRDDWSPVEKDLGETAWEGAKAELWREMDLLLEALDYFSDDRLDSEVPQQGYSYYVMLQGVIQHVAYHVGQIALLKRG